MREQLDSWVDAHRDEILESIRAVLRIPSVEGKPEPGAPFGTPIADALEHTLDLCERMGMQVDSFDGYAGHAEFGDGEQIVGMLGHLDVVPVGNGWTRDPWGAEISDGFLYGRGASDDKGPTFAAIWGAKAVLDVTREQGITLSRRIRLIFGCDEESGWECMDHYFGEAGQPQPDLAFTPDAEFPLVYAEKGALTVQALRYLPGSAALRITEMQSGLRANMVPDTASAIVAGEAELLAGLAASLAAREDVSAEPGDEGLRIVVRGRGAHASTPEQGENAAAKLLALLAGEPLFGAEERQWMADLARRAAIDGSGCGIAGSDEITGPLTLNMGVVNLVADGEHRDLRVTFNIRHPATWDTPATRERFVEDLRKGGWAIEAASTMAPLYVPQDEEPVRTLLAVYREHTGDTTPPQTMGGRTYATAVAPRGVAFGPAMPGDPEVAHQPDERISVDRLLQCARIYALALYELAK